MKLAIEADGVRDDWAVKLAIEAAADSVAAREREIDVPALSEGEGSGEGVADCRSLAVPAASVLDDVATDELVTESECKTESDAIAEGFCELSGEGDDLREAENDDIGDIVGEIDGEIDAVTESDLVRVTEIVAVLHAVTESDRVWVTEIVAVLHLLTVCDIVAVTEHVGEKAGDLVKAFVGDPVPLKDG